ncbi:Gfo/Idh/MocA family protein [Cohnella zeiphila]|uniref:Gfo/Idh/MocA family oxidoreductase n=1 Tax=Cohnella zeiphila TaxID=2761120 RepID=A0A7X0VY61_9BACL|nr:Gfo/Idh/MocA family oxidoreductase [Cohnella zeiphila]MBB6732623.1 Gfo/Idh/MocA family oxidoreductase [Cohnella zeiphila]
MIRIAILSYWHVHAKDYARQAAQHPDAAITALWDEDPVRGRAQAEALGVPYYGNLEELLAKPDIDAVIVTAPTTMHREVLTAAAEAGKHIFTEKVLAPTVRECREILKAVRRKGVRLMVSLPRLHAPFALAAKEAIGQGKLGELTLVRARLSHRGALSGELPDYFFLPEQTAGGAMIDLGCHPMVVTRLLLGMPESVSASYGYITGRDVEDNAAAVLRYPGGALGIVEAGFASRSPFLLEAHGTEGSLTFSAHSRKMIVAGTASGAGTLEEWPLPDAPPSPMDQWLSEIRSGTSDDRNAGFALDLTQLMEAANLSARADRAVRLSEIGEA